MAASLVGLNAFLAWSWITPLTVCGSEPAFGLVRWLGSVLLVVFTFVWLPLFPHVTAILAGMIAGPTLFAVIGYTFFGACMRPYDPPGIERSGGGAALLSFLATFVWILGAAWLSRRSRPGEAFRYAARPIYYAVWGGTVMLALALFGTVNYTIC